MLNIFKRLVYIASGKNAIIRYYRPDDIVAVREWMRDNDLVRYAFGIIAGDDDLRKLAEAFCYETENFGGNRITILDKSESPVGIIKLTPSFGQTMHVTIGILIGEKRNRGKSIGSEALILTINHLFKNKRISHVELDTATFNEPAAKCFLKCGFKRVKNFDETDYVTKIKMHKILFRITREDFRPFYEKYISEPSKEENPKEQK